MPERFFQSCFFCCSQSFQVLPPKSANATQSQIHQWVHVHHFSPSPPSATWQNADSSEAFFRDITPTPTQVHSRPNILSSLSSSVVGSIWQIVEMNNTKGEKKRKQPCQQQGLRFTVAPWFWQVTSAGSLMGNGDNEGPLWLSNCHTNNV